MELKQNLQSGLGQLDSPYMRYFLKLDPTVLLKDVKCPVLALNGKKDTQVFADNNIKTLEKHLPSGDFNMIMALDELNHLFQHCSTGSVTEYATIEETISPEVLELIVRWIQSISAQP